MNGMYRHHLHVGCVGLSFTFIANFTGHGLSMWIQYVDLQHLRKRKLASATQVLQVAHQRELLSSSFQIWRTALKCALRATSKAESMALHGRMKCVSLERLNPTLLLILAFINIKRLRMKIVISCASNKSGRS